ncbi:hypothetical protein PE074_06505 [Wohlfahrtiimonas chitiniclastica]|uniref:hypothetical protein n=1 Tax=Wohlfahrtiimonas chitiniclastica TaxID=400946 RepID=UPI0007B41C4C|nr:hypothetical protein [Wohlfahrtiimonas chitiniclastica]KZS22218.1 hypothetical protein BMY_0034 [Wohlfahrtiimonas chitiniclastica]MBS7814771.1 hypothetical protein [Wohlfahrtiimonas chitiniclastica]WHR54746.1 hypothetical protein PE074_06505 [Wohlfahrtiimonas chitiniclastica]
MQRTESVISSNSDRYSELKLLGLTEKILLDALTAGLHRRSEIVKGIHPQASPGNNFREGVFEELRTKLRTKGFIAEFNRGVELTQNDKIAIYLSRGCPATGISGLMPSSYNSKGEHTQQLFNLSSESHSLQENLFSIDVSNSGVINGTHQVWVLLFHIKESKEDMTIHAELSMPFSCDKQGRINSFSKRVILDTSGIKVQKYDVNINRHDNKHDAEFTEEIHLNVKLK